MLSFWHHCDIIHIISTSKSKLVREIIFQAINLKIHLKTGLSFSNRNMTHIIFKEEAEKSRQGRIKSIGFDPL